jgi:hypothetical protein
MATMMRRGFAGFGVWLLVLGGSVGCGDDVPNRPKPSGDAGEGGAPSEDETGGAGLGGERTGGGGEGGLVTAGAGAGGVDLIGAGGAGAGMASAPDCAADEACDDSNPCTDDACVEGACAYSNNTVACDDGNECTSDDACKDGSCQGANNEIGCDDLSSCTSDDKCGDGWCNGAKDLVLCPSCGTGANVLQNCEFSDGATHWVEGFVDGVGTQRVENERLIVDIVESGVEALDVQPRVEGLSLRHGMRYRLRLVAGASVERGAVVQIVQAAPPHALYGSLELQLGSQMKPFAGEFVVRSDVDDNARLVLALGGVEGNPSRVYVDDVALEEIPCGADDECDDGSDCTVDACAVGPGAGTCSWTNSGAACPDDGVGCTDDVCVAGACAHPPLEDGAGCVSDGADCTVDACEAGQCVHAYDTAVCACVLDEHCDDHNPCTDDHCSAGGCEYAENTVACDDGNGCTSADACSGGLCVGNANNASCDDGDVCTVGDACSGGFCESGSDECFDCSAGANLVANCAFSAGEAGWSPGFFGTATGSQRVEQGVLVVEITNGGVDPSKVQPHQDGLSLTQGATYRVSLNARASVARGLAVAIVRDGGDFAGYGGPHAFDLDLELQRYSFDFTMEEAPPVEGARLQLLLGGADDNASPSTVWIDNVTVGPKP